MINDIAVVIGSNIVGLLAARSLSEQYEIVIILEGDKITEKLNCDDGLSQSNNAHLLNSILCQVVAIPNVCLVDNAPILRLCIDHANNRVTGIVFDDRRANRVETLPCAMVVDASDNGLRSNMQHPEIGVDNLEQFVELTNVDMRMMNHVIPSTKCVSSRKVSKVARRLHVYRNYADIKPAYDARSTHTLRAVTLS